ncbi:MAG: hypothetical protein IK115_14530 [Lachnospiraceae bacterium]|nr:hypothetical protein [Lachnospiraceae bacterium]
MDNFMDKLAEKYNAQDMIRANSQAESAQLQNLQDQVEAYEAVLQEMRKLNYRNTELTEKMYALVDESIEKVRTLQIEAEGGANTEQVSREMTDAVKNTVSEALSSMDSTMVQSLKDTVQNMLTEPAAEIRQSSEEVKNSASAVQSTADDMRNGVDELKENIGLIREQNDRLEEKADDIQQKADDIQQALFEIRQTGTNTEESLASVAAAIAALQQGGISRSEMPEEVSREIPAGDDELKEKISSLIEELRQQSQIDALTQETLSALAQTNSQTRDSLTELRAAVGSLGEKGGEGEDDTLNTLLAAINKLQNDNQVLQESIQEIKNAEGELHMALDGMGGARVSDMEEIRTALNNAGAQLAALQEGSQGSVGGENVADNGEVRQALAELLSSASDTTNSIRSLKVSVDESKSNLKSAVDSGIYGLKQDNKEITAFLQRINSAVLNLDDSEEKARKEEEAAARAEEDKRALEERFKAAEDFMHKESVKVYRNVQAVINEKNDKQKESVENTNLSVEMRVNKVKALVIFNMIFTLINLAVTILYIFGILQM